MRKPNYTVWRRTELNRHLTDTYYYMEWRWITLANLRETSYTVWRVTHRDSFIITEETYGLEVTHYVSGTC